MFISKMCNLGMKVWDASFRIGVCKHGVSRRASIRFPAAGLESTVYSLEHVELITGNTEAGVISQAPDFSQYRRTSSRTLQVRTELSKEEKNPRWRLVRTRHDRSDATVLHLAEMAEKGVSGSPARAVRGC